MLFETSVYQVWFNADYTVTMARNPGIGIIETYKIKVNVVVIQLQCCINTSVNMCDIVPRYFVCLTLNREVPKSALKTNHIDCKVKTVLLFFIHNFVLSSTSGVTSVTWLLCPWFGNLWHVSVWNMSFTKKTGSKALDALQNLPRITLANLRPEPGAKKAVSYKLYPASLIMATVDKRSSSNWLRSFMPNITCTNLVKCRKNGVAEDNMVATEAVEVTKASGREEPDPGLVLRVASLLFIWSFQNMATTKAIGKWKSRAYRRPSKVQMTVK